jgi:hypothetical protein
MPRVFILGCHHALQSVEICWRWLELKEFLAAIEKDVEVTAREQKEHFARRVRELIATEHVTFIGEEADRDLTMQASLLCERWHPIDMSKEERERREIPFDYIDKAEKYTAENRARWDAEREQYMFQQVQENRGNAPTILVICGSNHMNALVSLFRQVGDDVMPPEDITKAPWFDCV